MTEREKFMGRFRSAREAGLVDIKFFVPEGESLSAEEIFAAANRMEDAVQDGRCVRSQRWGLDVEPTPSALLA